ncbi:hypothetical protein EVAR_99662_1 [Eumeta japonica]|uniref:Uncharacterized protein n=1 Tax=Eumeta variegata TaxID=151549 RepID=A0A4C2AHS7_EUMVA|nr:hypothetical protein EVAR_99662_1 [Eumeta japonica]
MYTPRAVALAPPAQILHVHNEWNIIRQTRPLLKKEFVSRCLVMPVAFEHCSTIPESKAGDWDGVPERVAGKIHRGKHTEEITQQRTEL